jgi:protoheme IX farnesyltransferase
MSNRSPVLLIRVLLLATIVVTFGLLLLGGYVHNTGSSLACPDWPTCYGSFFPKMEGQILIEHGHRLLATTVGFITTIICILCFRRREVDPRGFKLSLAALGFVILQGVLGGITVLYKLPTIVSTSHLALSMIYFGTIIYVHHYFKPQNYAENTSSNEKNYLITNMKSSLKHWVFFCLGLLYVQIILGAFMRHSGAGTSCGLGIDNAFLCLDSSTWKTSLWPTFIPAQVHMVHRYLAGFVGLAYFVFMGKVIFLFISKDFSKKVSKGFLIYSTLILLVVIFQILLGILTVAFNISPLPTTLHLGGAALLLALTWKLNLELTSLEEDVFLKRQDSFLSDLMDLIKPKLSALVIATAFFGMLLAPGEINFFKGLFSLFMISLTVFGACALNCYIEIDVDDKMTRTKDRPLPAGRMNKTFVLTMGNFLLLFSLLNLGFFVNWETAGLALLAAVLYLFAYTPMKLKSAKAVYLGAIPGAIPPILGWTSVTGELDKISLSLFALLFIWQIPHFMAISIFNAKDYDAANIKVYPNLKGLTYTKVNMLIFTLFLTLVSLLPYYWGRLGQVYLVSAIVLGGSLSLISTQGFFISSSEEVQSNWARKYFLGTVIYLPLLLCAMIFFQ